MSDHYGELVQSPLGKKVAKNLSLTAMKQVSLSYEVRLLWA